VPAQRPSPQNVPPWFVAISLAGVIYTAVALGVLTLYSRRIGLLMLLPVGAFLVVTMARALLIYMLFEAGRWLYGRL
jgi:hypothetical protein